MTAPTKASLQRAEKQARDALEMRDRAIQMHDEAWALIDDLQAELKATRARLRPVLAYFGEQWIGDAVRADYQALVTFCERTGR